MFARGLPLRCLRSKSRWPLSGTSRIAERFYFNLCKTFQLNWGPPQRFRFNMSKNARAECKVKTRFQALLRRCRFSRRSLNERCQPRFELIDDAKLRCAFAMKKNFFKLNICRKQI